MTDFSIRPVGAPVAAPVVRSVADAVPDAVPTQLPADKAVAATAPLLAPPLSAANYAQADAERISKGIIVDREAAEIVYVSVDKKTNQIVNQYPEETRLRTRAYLRAMDAARQDSRAQERRLETDRSV